MRKYFQSKIKKIKKFFTRRKKKINDKENKSNNKMDSFIGMHKTFREIKFFSEI